jgi:hypothetical protein
MDGGVWPSTHSNARTATRFGQTDAGLLCHVAVSGDGRTPAAGENRRCQNQFEMDDLGGVEFGSSEGTSDNSPAFQRRE